MSKKRITTGCPAGQRPVEGANCSDDKTINISTKATDKENDPLTYTYTVSGGRIVGNGANVSWDMTGVQPGNYTVTVGANDGCGICGQTKTETITVEKCDCDLQCPTCGSVNVSSNGVVQPGDDLVFTANVSGGSGNFRYDWTVSNGQISGSSDSATIRVGTAGMAGQDVTATVRVIDLGRGNCPTCDVRDDETGSVAKLPEPYLFDTCDANSNPKCIKPDDIKIRVDNFYIELNNNPSATGYIITYGTPKEIARREQIIKAAIKFRKYDPSRVVFVNGGNTGEGTITKFWIVPAGATAPQP
ncbi:MAG TPA: hypothetical protein PKE69_11010 [Pyrinomonadaceae bacterium]|nr:hypothetical protein [Pyrinomonadaceae bacterium]